MNAPGSRVLLTVDVGNTSIRFDAFDRAEIRRAIVDCSGNPADWPDAISRFHTATPEPDFTALGQWLASLVSAVDMDSPKWKMVSVNEPAAVALRRWIEDNELFAGNFTLLQHSDFGMPLNVEYPEQVGPDRLAASAAANLFRTPGHAAIVIDAGTALTVDLVSAAGEFEGGTIGPGMVMSLEALAQRTDRLPRIEITSQSAPEVIGHSTEQAITAGVFWGQVGAIREMVRRIEKHLAATDTRADVFFTGGNARELLHHLPTSIVHIPNLVQIGICAAGQ